MYTFHIAFDILNGKVFNHNYYVCGDSKYDAAQLVNETFGFLPWSGSIYSHNNATELEQKEANVNTLFAALSVKDINAAISFSQSI